jgi:hypothetical protein
MRCEWSRKSVSVAITALAIIEHPMNREIKCLRHWAIFFYRAEILPVNNSALHIVARVLRTLT